MTLRTVTSQKVIFHDNFKLMHNFITSAFVAALERVKAIREGRCAPVVTFNDGDQSRVTPGSIEAAVLGYQLTVGLDHNPCYPYMSPWMKVTYCGDYATVCQQEVAAVMPVKNDHIKIVLKLISLGAEVNMPDFTGETPLHLCLRATAEFPIDSSIKIAKALLRAGADANQQDRFGRTPLLAATICQKFSLMSLLLQHGADPFIAANNGLSPFSISSSHPRALQIFSKFSKAACKEARAGQKEAAGGNLHGCAAAGCGENATKKCRGCFSVWYCSTECQHRDWRGNHEAVCKVRKVVKSSSIMSMYRFIL